MSTRKTYVYRLDVTFPPRSHPDMPDYRWDWAPEGWGDDVRAEWMKYRAERDAYLAAGGDMSDPFSVPLKPTTPEDVEWTGWPSVRQYLSRSGAEKRADLFRRYGAVVEVVQSQPVEWEAS